MKKTLFILTLLISITGHSQTAFDWTKGDCSSTSHTLFSYLDNEEVVIMEFAMGCGGCTNAATYLLQTKDKYAVSNPGKVKVFYMDYWASNDCATDVIPTTAPYAFDAVFDHCQPELSAYMTGAPMPAVVIAAGSNHQVIYQMNSFMPVDTMAIETAITNFFATISVQENFSFNNLSLYPNPTKDITTLNFSNSTERNLSITVHDISGRMVREIKSGHISAGSHKIIIDLTGINSGMYTIRLFDGINSSHLRIVRQ